MTMMTTTRLSPMTTSSTSTRRAARAPAAAVRPARPSVSTSYLIPFNFGGEKAQAEPGGVGRRVPAEDGQQQQAAGHHAGRLLVEVRQQEHVLDAAERQHAEHHAGH